MSLSSIREKILISAQGKTGITSAKERKQENNFSDISIKVKAGVGEQILTFLMILEMYSLKERRQG